MNTRCTLRIGALLLSLFVLPVVAATGTTLQKYAEAVDLLDRWRGDREVLDAAHDRLTELLIEAPEFAPAHVELARWYLMNSRNNASALKALERAEALEPDFAGTYVLRGYILQKQQRFDEALAELDRAEAIGTDNPWLQLNRGYALQGLGREQEALPLFRQVFETHTEHPKAWPAAKHELLNYFDSKGDSASAEQIHQRAMALNPLDPEPVAAYAHWLGQGRRYDDAIRLLRTQPGAPSGQDLEVTVLSLLSAKALDLQTQMPDSEPARAAYSEMAQQAQTLGISPLPSFEDWSAQAGNHARMHMQ